MMKANKQTISKNGCSCASKNAMKAVCKREYIPLLFSPLAIECDNAILTGSVMDQKIKVNEVKVTDFQAGFDIGDDHQDFFEVTFE